MKILMGSQQPAVATQTADSRTEKTESAVTQQKSAAKPPRTADKVDLSASLTTGTQTQQELQAKRVESLKSLIKAGNYQVSSHDIAEKMLSDSFGF